MADLITTFLSLVKPDVGSSRDTWGDKTNGNWDKVDQLFAAGPALKVANGGTGGTTAEQARANLGAASLGPNSFTGDQVVNGNLTVNGAITGGIPAGTRMLFQQTSAPVGWTKDTSQNDKALRVVSGNASAGGTIGFSAAFANRVVDGSTDARETTGSVQATVLTAGQMPAHRHLVVSNQGSQASLSGSSYLDSARDSNNNNNYTLGGITGDANLGLSSQQGNNEGHTHGFTGGSHSHAVSANLDMSVAYVDLIIAVKN
jgi:microcystin-dependent protein